MKFRITSYLNKAKEAETKAGCHFWLSTFPTFEMFCKEDVYFPTMISILVSNRLTLKQECYQIVDIYVFRGFQVALLTISEHHWPSKLTGCLVTLCTIV